MFSELTVILKGDDRTYREKFPIYESYSISYDDPEVQKCIITAKANFIGEPESVQIKITFEVV